jgi:class 3 adenylate cyclase
VLFTDLVGSTSALTEMGDERWAEKIQQHNDFCRGAFDEMDAWAVKSTGDGFIACFPTPHKAVSCGLRLLAAMPELGLAARAGLHTGELERVDIDDVAGLTPVIASRISDLAGPDELLASRSASELLVGSEHTIHSHGLHHLKGVADPVEIVRIDEPSVTAGSLDFTTITRALIKRPSTSTPPAVGQHPPSKAATGDLPRVRQRFLNRTRLAFVEGSPTGRFRHP